MAKKWRILALDGGGIRGIYTLELLQRLADGFDGFLSNVNVFAGTSTGSIIALGLAAGKTPSQLLALYEKFGPKVFKRLWTVPAGLSPRAILTASALFNAKYENRSALRTELNEQLGTTTKLGELPRKVFITSFQLDSGPKSPSQSPTAGKYWERTWKPKFFHNFDVSGADKDERVVDVAIRSTAAPVYFPSSGPYIDGGVVANSPSAVALMQVLYDSGENPGSAEIALLSVGTGRYDQYVEEASTGKDLNWGVVQWASRLVDIWLGSGMSMADWQCRKMLGAAYHRLDPGLPEAVDLDVNDEKEFRKLKDRAKSARLTDAVRTQETTIEWLKAHF